MKNEIIIEDWAGNVLFQGNYDSPKVLKITRKNYAEDIFISWTDRKDNRNVYEFIDFDFKNGEYEEN